jgi:hypothetical protein
VFAHDSECEVCIGLRRSVARVQRQSENLGGIVCTPIRSHISDEIDVGLRDRGPPGPFNALTRFYNREKGTEEAWGAVVPFSRPVAPPMYGLPVVRESLAPPGNQWPKDQPKAREIDAHGASKTPPSAVNQSELRAFAHDLPRFLPLAEKRENSAAARGGLHRDQDAMQRLLHILSGRPIRNHRRPQTSYAQSTPANFPADR